MIGSKDPKLATVHKDEGDSAALKQSAKCSRSKASSIC